MSKLQHSVWLRFVKLLDVLWITLPFAACWYGYYVSRIQISLGQSGKLAILLIYIVLYLTFGNIYDAFRISTQKVTSTMFGQMLATMVADGIIYIVICLLAGKFCNLIPGIGAWQ